MLPKKGKKEDKIIATISKDKSGAKTQDIKTLAIGEIIENCLKFISNTGSVIIWETMVKFKAEKNTATILFCPYFKPYFAAKVLNQSSP